MAQDGVGGVNQKGQNEMMNLSEAIEDRRCNCSIRILYVHIQSTFRAKRSPQAAQ
jgi:hypothetical protein